MKQRFKLVDAYNLEMGCDPTSVVREELMSDEASGPEHENEDEDEWESRMAVKSGLIVEGSGTRVNEFPLKFREHIKPEWRSVEVSSVKY